MFRLPYNNNDAAATGEAPAAGWVRPADWLEIDSLVNEGDEKFVGLHLVAEDSNFLSLSAAGAYTVDWGDGIVENYATGVQCHHQYNYADFVGTESTKGYRQAIVTVTPQVAGQFTNIDLQKKHNQAGLNAYRGGWLDIVMSAPSMTSMSIGLNTVYHTYLEQFTLKGNHSVTSMSYMFRDCGALQSIPLFDTASVTSMSYMFYGCGALQSIPLFDTSLVTNMGGMFSGCNSLTTAPLFDTSSVTNMSNMFYGCSSLQSVPLFNTSLVTNMSNMLSTCSLLGTTPLFDTSSATNMSNMFLDCFSLSSIPLFNVLSVDADYKIGNIFFNCNSLIKGVLINSQLNISYENCKLSSNAIEEIFNNLATVTAKTITITGNWGTPLLTAGQLAIATNKGWTIVS